MSPANLCRKVGPDTDQIGISWAGSGPTLAKRWARRGTPSRLLQQPRRKARISSDCSLPGNQRIVKTSLNINKHTFRSISQHVSKARHQTLFRASRVTTNVLQPSKRLVRQSAHICCWCWVRRPSMTLRKTICGPVLWRPDWGVEQAVPTANFIRSLKNCSICRSCASSRLTDKFSNSARLDDRRNNRLKDTANPVTKSRHLVYSTDPHALPSPHPPNLPSRVVSLARQAR